MAETQFSSDHENQKNRKSNFLLSRERSFVRPSPKYQQSQDPYMFQIQFLKDKKNKNMQLQVNSKGKPTMEIYRPPNVRMDGTPATNLVSPKLNVHAKEFTTKYSQLPPSRSSVGLLLGLEHGNYLQQSLSSGNILHEAQNPISHRVHFNLPSVGNKMDPSVLSTSPGKSTHKANDGKVKAVHESRQVRFQSNACPPGIQRSKSLGAADMKNKRVYGSHEAMDLGNFPPQIQATIFKAVEDPNQVPARLLMDLVRSIIERVLESRRYAEPAAKLCIKIIENEKKETFLETLLNNCQQWYQERNRFLKGTPNKFSAFMAFLNEMYCQLKRMQLQLKTHQEGVPPRLVLLTLLCKCCQDCVASPSVSSLNEIESLFFVLTAIGKDLEQELPKQLEIVLSRVRDAFLTAQTAPNIRKTLLQLIELSAARWQLPAPAVIYYYPGTAK
ncbi:hypothetical protein RUM43_006009 [Polyplax serrata]